MSARPVLIAWQDHVADLAYRRLTPFDHPKHRDRLQAFCTTFSHTGKGMTGRDCWLPPSLLKRFSRRTAYRYLKALVDYGLVQQTQAAARGHSARYQLVVPDNACQFHEENWHAKTTRQLAHVRAQQASGNVASLSTTRAKSALESVTGRRPPVTLHSEIAA